MRVAGTPGTVEVSMILVVDDDPDFLESVGGALEPNRGVFLAHDATHAMELIASLQGFSVALVDLDLPGTDGFALIRNLHETHPELPTIAIGDVVREDVLQSARKIGAAAVLRKPVTREWKSVVDRIRQGLPR
jgi:CheY-like chemotaxis protein